MGGSVGFPSARLGEPPKIIDDIGDHGYPRRQEEQNANSSVDDQQKKNHPQTEVRTKGLLGTEWIVRRISRQDKPFLNEAPSILTGHTSRRNRAVSRFVGFGRRFHFKTVSVGGGFFSVLTTTIYSPSLRSQFFEIASIAFFNWCH